MKPFVQAAIARAGLLPVLAARKCGDPNAARAALAQEKAPDIMALGALADFVRREEVGDPVRIYEGRGAALPAEHDVVWVDGLSELELLRAVAVVRLTSPRGARVGIDWGRHGLELAQVALGFGASDMRGPIIKKSGLPILDAEARKVKGEGMIDLASLKKREIAALVSSAGRVALFVAEGGRLVGPPNEEAQRARQHP